MPAYSTVSRDDLIQEAYASLYRTSEKPARLVVGSNALATTSETTFTLSTGVLNVTDWVESPAGEVMLVTAKSSDADPIYTVARQYEGPDSEACPTGTVLLKRPTFKRWEVRNWIERAINSILNTELPYVESNLYSPHATYQYIELPDDTIDVLRVRHFGVLDGRVADVGAWAFEDDIPTSIVTSGRLLRVGAGVTADDELIVTVRRPYSFSDATDDGTVDLPLAAVDVPVLWASAYALARREVSRSELDKIEEWNQEQAIRAGVNLRAVRDAWGEVYRRVDEAKRLHRVPKKRVYRKIPKGW